MSTPRTTPTFASVCAAVRDRVSYLHCVHLDADGEPGCQPDDRPCDRPRDRPRDRPDARVGQDRSQDWIFVASLGRDPDLLEALIRATGAARGAPTPAVAASLFVQSLAFRAPSLAVAAWALGLPSPTLDPSNVAVRITRNRPGALGIQGDALIEHDAAGLAAAVIDGLLAPVIRSVRSRIVVAERLLWSDVAASIAAILRAVEGTGAHGDREVRRRGQELFAVDARLASAGAWETIEMPAATGWYWNRSACCLWYRTTEANGRFCDDCSLVDSPERTERRRRELEGRPA